MKQTSSAEKLDEVIERFEQAWSAMSQNRLAESLQEFGLDDDLDAATELVRIDIARRYSEGMTVDLTPYFQQFPDLRTDPGRAPLIAFEDYRSRSSRGLPTEPDRWSELPGVSNQPWFSTALASAPSNSGASSGGGLTSSFRDSLLAAGFSPLRQIGEGAFSKVFLAVQRELSDRYVVLKVVDRPLEEPQQLARLQHTNIVPIYSFHRVASKYVLCMPYAGSLTLADYLMGVGPASSRDGQSLATTVRGHLLDTIDPADGGSESASADDDFRPAADDNAAMKPLERIQSLEHHELAIWLFSRLAAALSHSHARGVVHCDLKPANILIRNDGEPALLDFNLSRKLDRASESAAGGTLPYMAPEYLRALVGPSVCQHIQADIYSMGVILYEFVTGRLPFPAPRSRAPLDLELAIGQRQVELKWEPDDAVPHGLRCIIQHCLHYDPSQRYRLAEQLQRDLECERNHLPLEHTPEPSLRHRAAKWTRRHPRLASASFVVSISCLVVAALGLIAWQLNESNRHLAAQSNRDQFLRDSQRALAELLSVGRGDVTSRLDRADACLEMYDVLSEPDWQQLPSLSYLDAASRQLVIHRLADLLLRASSTRMAISQAEPDSAAADRANLQKRYLAAGLRQLRSGPFRTIAPVAIARLSRRTGSPSLTQTVLPELKHEHPVDLFAESLFLLDQGRPDEALAFLQPELLNVIDSFSYWIALGRCQLERSQLQAAELSFSMAVQEFRESPIGHYYRGKCRMGMPQQEKRLLAESDFSTAIERDPLMLEAYVSRALAREATGDLQGALADIGVVAQVEENSIRSLMIRSRLHRKLGQLQLSQSDFREVLKRQPSTVDDWVIRATARLATDIRGALDDLVAAEQMDPTSLLVLQNKAHVLAEHLGQPEPAVDCLTRLLSLYPSFEKAILGRAVLQARLGRNDLALQDLSSATQQIDSWTPASLYQAACVYALISSGLPDEEIAESGTRSESPSEIDKSGAHWMALKYLSQAIQRGYGGDLIGSDPDLDPLRGLQAFRMIQETVRLGQGS